MILIIYSPKDGHSFSFFCAHIVGHQLVVLYRRKKTEKVHILCGSAHLKTIKNSILKSYKVAPNLRSRTDDGRILKTYEPGTGWMVRSSKPGKGKRFFSSP